jgi:hypothetical protein
MLNHPAVLEWLAGRRALGDRAALRMFKNKHRFEQGVRDNVSSHADAWIAIMAARLVERERHKRLSVEAIRRRLLISLRKNENPAGLSLTTNVRAVVCRRLGSRRNLQYRLDLLCVIPRESFDAETSEEQLSRGGQ